MELFSDLVYTSWKNTQSAINVALPCIWAFTSYWCIVAVHLGIALVLQCRLFPNLWPITSDHLLVVKTPYAKFGQDALENVAVHKE